MRMTVGWTIGAALGVVIVMVFFAIVASRMVQTPVGVASPQTTESRR